MECFVCNRTIPDDAEICQFCGAMIIKCHRSKILPGSVFCEMCGVTDIPSEDGDTSVCDYVWHSDMQEKYEPDAEIIIDKYIGTGTEISIPEKINGRYVRRIADKAFCGCASLTSVIIPDSVSHIGRAAFKDCTSLKSVSLPYDITEISQDMFCNCKSLTSVTIPEEVNWIDDSAFENCTSLEYVNIPGDVSCINKRVFKGCTSLKSVSIPHVSEIYEEAFFGCTALTEVSIPDNSVDIAGNAFKGTPFEKNFDKN